MSVGKHINCVKPLKFAGLLHATHCVSLRCLHTLYSHIIAGSMAVSMSISMAVLLLAVLSICNGARLTSRASFRDNQLNNLLSSATRRVLESRPLLGLDRQNKNLRVLAFGDSITEGWIQTAWTKVSFLTNVGCVVSTANCCRCVLPTYVVFPQPPHQ